MKNELKPLNKDGSLICWNNSLRSFSAVQRYVNFNLATQSTNNLTYVPHF